MTTATATPPAPRQGEEDLRFIRNFHDVFLAMGLGLFAAGVGIVSLLIFGQAIGIGSLADIRNAGWGLSGVMFLDAGVMWGLAEIFARRRRLFLPAIMILVAFSGFFMAGLLSAYVMSVAAPRLDTLERGLEDLRLLPIVVFGGGAAAVFAYYVRMKLPFAMGLGAALIAAAAVTTVGIIAPSEALRLASWLQLGAGLFLFGLGLAFDARDPARATRFADNAFWLHFFAAPLIFGGVMALANGGPSRFGMGGSGSAAVSLGIVAAFALVSLLINRRALLVAGLLSAGLSIGSLISGAGLSGAWSGALTLLVLGGAMVLLGGGWSWARARLVAPFPKTGPIARIIPPEADPEDARA